MEMPSIKNVLLEEAILASAICDDSSLDEFAYRLKREDFTDPYNANIAGELIKCATKGYTPDIVLMAERLGADYIDKLSSLMTVTATSSNIKEQCQKLREVTSARMVVSKAMNVVMKANAIDDHEDFVNWSVSQFSDIEWMSSDSALEHISTGFGDAIQEYSDICAGKQVGLLTGIADLDKQTNGIRAGEYVIIAGRPAQGKTSLALTIMKNIALQGKKVGFFSLEMSKTEVIFKLSSMISSTNGTTVPLSAFRGTSESTGEHFKSFKMSLEKLRESGIYINDSGRTTCLDIELEFRRFVKKLNLDLAVIDYIGLVNDDGSSRGKKRHEQLQTFSIRFKNLFKDLKVAGIVLAQMKQDAYNRKPTMGDLGESGQMGKDAHMIYLLHQPDEKDPTKKILVCDKGRGVGKGDFALHFSTTTTEFWSMSQRETEEYFQYLSSEDQEKKVGF